VKRRSVEALIRWLRDPAAGREAAGLELGDEDAAELARWLEARLPPEPSATTRRQGAVSARPAAGGAGGTALPGAPAAGARARLHCDGASRGNPGPAALGVVVYLGDEEVHREAEALGELSNNQAEYHALLAGLAAVRRLGFARVDVYLDSELIVRQLEGRYKVKSPGLRPLFDRARRTLAEFDDWSVQHVPRAQNAVADALANSALDSL
jgi:ribonuclease HI